MRVATHSVFSRQCIAFSRFSARVRKANAAGPNLEQFFPPKPASPHLPEKRKERQVIECLTSDRGSLFCRESSGCCVVELVLVLAKMEHIDNSEDLTCEVQHRVYEYKH